MNNIDSEKLKAMLKAAADKLGTTPENLKNAAEKGDLSQILSASKNENLKNLLSDPEKARSLINSEKAKKLKDLLSSGGKEQ